MASGPIAEGCCGVGGWRASLGACANASHRLRQGAQVARHRQSTANRLSLDPHKCLGDLGKQHHRQHVRRPHHRGRAAPNRSPAWPNAGRSARTASPGRSICGARNWSDGEACDAHDFEFAFQRILDPATPGPIRRGPLSDQERRGGQQRAHAARRMSASPRSMTSRWRSGSRIRRRICPQLLKHYTAFPVPKHKVEQFGDALDQAREHRRQRRRTCCSKWWSNYIVHLSNAIRASGTTPTSCSRISISIRATT